MSSHEIGHFQGNNFSINETHQICTSSKQESLSYHSFLLEFCFSPLPPPSLSIFADAMSEFLNGTLSSFEAIT